MRNPHAGWWGLPRPVGIGLAAPAAAAALSVALSVLGFGQLAVWLGRAALAGAAVVAVVALVRGSRGGPWRARLSWLVLAAAAAVQTAWLLGPGSGAGPAGPAGSLSSAIEPGYLLVAGLVLVALWLVPGPRDTRHGVARTVLDAATAGFAFAVPVSEALIPSGSDLLAADSWTILLHPLVDVALATAAVAALSRARDPGGLAVRPLAALVLGVATLGFSDVLPGAGAEPAAVLALTTGVLLLWSVAGLVASYDEIESDRTVRWRERVAVLVPLAPLTVASAVLAGAAVFAQSLTRVTLACAVLLAAALIAGGVLARLDSLATERSLEDLVLKRTLSLGEREKWFRSLVRNSSDVITVVDVRGVVRYLTPSVTRMLGHAPDPLVGTRINALLRPADGRRLDAALATAARTPGRPVTLEFPIWATDGSWRETETTVTSLVHDPDIRGLVLNTRDVSERRRLEEQLTQQAFSDGLTGLANRALFRTKVETALKVALGPAEVAVLFLDLDGFKAVNDAQGHHVGDEVLVIVAKRLTGSVRPGDLVARLGGDEFAILVTGRGAEEGARWVAERVRRALAAPFVLDGREMLLGASVGIAVSDTGDETVDQLQRNADLAMYRAKNLRDQTFVRFEAQMHDALLARVKAESELRAAVTHGDLVLHYQPVVELISGRITGVEALVRWRHHELGLIPPGDFIELAEQTGLVTDIGRWALTESARQAVAWQRHAMPGGYFRVAVNVSGRQLDAGLPRLVRDSLAASGLPGQALTLEMTESVLMERTEEAVELLKRIKTLGVRVAVDDFGTGYSSLSYLSRFPVDILKVDKSFVQHVGEDSGQGELVRTIVQLGTSLRLETVAEGIETPAQRAALEAMGCTFGQGYLFARALPAADVDDLLEEQSRSSTGVEQARTPA